MITPLPTPPSRSDPANFAERADDFLGALPLFQTEANSLQADVNAKQITATNAANTATAAANAASAATGVTVWVSGTTYAVGDNRFSPLNFLTYRRKTAGAGTTDPSLDTTNWAQISGTGNLSVDGSGKLGLGTGSPTSLLTILSTPPEAANLFRNVNVLSSGTAAVRIELGALVGSTPTVAGSISGILASSGNQGLLTFSTLNGASLVERVRIDDSGRLAIGTTSPQGLLDVSSNSTTQVYIRAANNASSELYFSDAAGNPGTINYNHNDNSMSFFTNGSSRMTIDQAGSLFVGSSATSSKVYVNSTASDMCVFNATNAVGSYVTFGRNNAPFGYLGAAAGLVAGGLTSDMSVRSEANLIFAISSVERMRINSLGNVGIGIDPLAGYKLEVDGVIASTRGAGTAPVLRLNQSGTAAWAITNPSSTANLSIVDVGAGNLTRFNIDGAGNVSFNGTSTYQGNEIGWRNKRVVTATSNSDLVLGFMNYFITPTTISLTVRTAGSTFDIVNISGGSLILAGTGGVQIRHSSGSGSFTLANYSYITVTYLSATEVIIRGSGIT